MKLLINHQTYYQYERPVKNSMQYIRLLPQENARQKIHQWGLSVPGEKIQQVDGFGNALLASSQRKSYQNLMIMAQGMVEIDTEAEYTIDDHLAPEIFLQTTKATMCSAEMMQFAHMHTAGEPDDGLRELAVAVLEHIPYTSGLTQVETTAIEAFEQRKGVCQDHAQVFVALARYLGHPARYVSGYLYVEDGNHLASHAWAEVYKNGKWLCFDISNQLFTPCAHVQLAVGRDYADVAPIRGVRQEGDQETMSSIVQVLMC